MINLNEIPSKDLAKILKLRLQIEIHEREMIKVIQAAKKKGPSLASSVRYMHLPKKAQPSLRDMISGILQKSGKPMTVAEIYEASVVAGYMWRSKEPMNALNVKIYTDDTFLKVAPGKFVLKGK